MATIVKFANCQLVKCNVAQQAATPCRLNSWLVFFLAFKHKSDSDEDDDSETQEGMQAR